MDPLYAAHIYLLSERLQSVYSVTGGSCVSSCFIEFEDFELLLSSVIEGERVFFLIIQKIRILIGDIVLQWYRQQ